MTDDLRREAIPFVERGSVRRLGHGGIRADHKRLDNASLIITTVGGRIALWSWRRRRSDISGNADGDVCDRAEASRSSWRTPARVRACGMSQSNKRTVQFPCNASPRYLIHDRDTAFHAWRTTADAMGIEEVLTAPRSPWQNGYAERLIGSIRRECLDHVIIGNRARTTPSPAGLRGLLPAMSNSPLTAKGCASHATGCIAD